MAAVKPAAAQPTFRARLSLMALVIAATACGVFEELDPRLRFGTVPELPEGIDVPQDFERGGDGFALDIPQAFERFNECYDSVRLDAAAKGAADLGEDKELFAMLCSQAAGNGWFPGNRPDEARLLNEQAITATECIRERGWDYPDPVPERFGRFLEVEDPAAPGVKPDDVGQARQLADDVASCLDENVIDWSQWVIENPRN